MTQPHLDFRGDSKELYSEPMVHPAFLRERRCRIILIHGFNNSRQQAISSFSQFKRTYAALDRFYSDNIFFLIWPGDHISVNPSFFFSKNVDIAIATGKSLGRYLDEVIRNSTQECRYVLIAHSLGCRVVAEMMDELRRINPDACRQFSLLLMAGAVPAGDFLDPSSLRESLKAARSVANLYSPDDGVLRNFFGLGQMLAGHSRTEAIGLNGAPLDLGWKLELMKGFGHSDYWIKEESVRVLASTLNVAGEMRPPESRIAELRHPVFEPAELTPESWTASDGASCLS